MSTKISSTIRQQFVKIENSSTILHIYEIDLFRQILINIGPKNDEIQKLRKLKIQQTCSKTISKMMNFARIQITLSLELRKRMQILRKSKDVEPTLAIEGVDTAENGPSKVR